MTQSIAGHIADVGTYKGASALLFAKLMKIHNPESLWQVHGFDWFKGTPKLSVIMTLKYTPEGGYTTSEKLLLRSSRKAELIFNFSTAKYRFSERNRQFYVRKFSFTI
jgi:hypothetical protein